MADRKTAWARRLGEGARAYEYAWEYFKMGPHRSIEKVAQEFAKNKRPLKRYSRKWQWVKRAAAYDRSIEAQKLQTAEAFEKAEAQKWAQRERNQRQRRLLLVERLIEAVETMLKVPLTEVIWVTTVDADGRKIQNQIIKPMVALQDALSFVVTGVVLTGQAIRNEIAIHSGVAEIDIYECAAPQIAADRKTVWARRPGEGARAYKYAWEYFTMGPGRSIARVAQKFAKNKRPLKRHSWKWQWVKRAAAYDRSIETKKREAAEAFAKVEEQTSTQRQRDQRERLFLLGERFMETGNTILRFPLTEVTRVTQVDADGRATQMQIIKPVRWAQRDIVSFMMTGFALGDQAIRNEEARVRAPAWP